MGLDAGLHQTGRFEVLAAVEKEAAFCATIRANRDTGLLPSALQVLHADVRTVDPLELLERVDLKQGELDLLVGGPPCQSFSTAGRRGTTQDPRGALLWEFLRFVEVIQPKFFLMENVRGLLSAALRHRRMSERPEQGGSDLALDESAGSVIKMFADDLQGIEPRYHMDCFEVNAVNYGAPQLRERALFIGNRFDQQVDFPDPTHGQAKDVQVSSPDLFARPTPLKPWATLRDAIGGLSDPGETIMDFSPRKKSYLSKVPPGSNWRSLSHEDQKTSMGKAWFAKGGRSGWWRRLTYDLPCPTLVTMPNHASTSLCHPVETRALSLKEYAQIQEFPAGWAFAGTAAQRYAQVGNAVPVRLGTVAGEVIAGALDRLVDEGLRPGSRAPNHFRVVYVQSHVRTRQWFKDGKALVWDAVDGQDTPSYAPPMTVRREKRMVGS